MAFSFGNMFASLTLESASFMSGMDAARKQIGMTQKRFAEVGGGLQKVGAILSVGITAPFAAMGAAALGSAREMAGSVTEIQKSAQLANVTTSEFQRLAFAAKSVGFESEKLTDVYKDVNDRVGEFISTGGGEMKDFFEKVAPKVGITAAAFKGLSGPQALQLYYNSLQKAGLNQQQMTFYMEAMADEATALMPLLQNNGKAMGEIGAKAAVIPPQALADMKRYTEAQRVMEQSIQKVTIAIVSSGLLEGITSITTKLTDLTGGFASTNPELFKWGIVLGGAAAALGPVVAGIGTFVTVIGSALPAIAALRLAVMTQAIPALVAFTATAAPIALPIIAVGAAIGGMILAIRNWDKIKPYVDKVVGWMAALYTGVKTWISDKLNAIWDGLRKRIDNAKQWFFGLYDAVVGHSYIPDMVDEIGQHVGRLDTLMVAPIARMTKASADAFATLRGEVQGILDGIFPEEAEVRRLQDQLAKVNALFAAGQMKPEVWAAARGKIIGDLLAAQADAEAKPAELPGAAMGGMGDLADKAASDLEKAWGRVQAANDNTIASFAEMARDVAGSLGNFAQSVKSGDWLGALQGALDSISQIAGIIKGTGAPAQRTYSTNSFGGARANGGPVLPRRDYLVGERGPEILRMGGVGGSVVPNDHLGGGLVQIAIEEGALFRPVVRSEAGQVSVQTVANNNRMGALRGRQSLGSGR